MKIEKDIISILAKCQVEGNHLRITEQLDRKTYAQLNKVLTALGGKWKAAKKVHEFAEDVEALLEEVITTGEYSCIKKDFLLSSPLLRPISMWKSPKPVAPAGL